MMCGILTINIDRFLPSGSRAIPDSTLPNGWHIKAILPKKKIVKFKITFLYIIIYDIVILYKNP